MDKGNTSLSAGRRCICPGWRRIRRAWGAVRWSGRCRGYQRWRIRPWNRIGRLYRRRIQTKPYHVRCSTRRRMSPCCRPFDSRLLAVAAVIARDILANTAQEQAHVFRATMMLPTGCLTGVPCCAGSGSRGIKLRPHAAIFQPRGPSAGYERPSRPFGLQSLTQQPLSSRAASGWRPNAGYTKTKNFRRSNRVS